MTPESRFYDLKIKNDVNHCIYRHSCLDEFNSRKMGYKLSCKLLFKASNANIHSAYCLKLFQERQMSNYCTLCCLN